MNLDEKLISLVDEKGMDVLFDKDTLSESVSGCFNQGKSSVFEACVSHRFFAHMLYKTNMNEVLFIRHKETSGFLEHGADPAETKYVVDSFVRVAEHLRKTPILSLYNEKNASQYELLAAAVRSYDKGLYRPAVTAFTSLSGSGVDLAHYYLGKCFFEGKAVPKDVTKAAKAFAKGVEVGSSYSTYYMGTCFMKGLGIKIDAAKGTILLRKAAEMGQEDAVFAVGYMYKENIPKNSADIKKAIEYLQASADYGNWSAAITICDLYYEDAKTTGNFNKTSSARDRIARIKDPETCFKLANIYERGIGVPVNLEKALNFSTKAASGGYPGATEMMTRIGNMKLGR